MFVVLKSLKKIILIVSNNKFHLTVTHPSMKEFLLSKDIIEKRVGWITCLMEYDVDIQVTKLVRGKGLCKQLAHEKAQTTNDIAEPILANKCILE